MGPLDIVVAIVALCVVIILHEAGHYLAAVASGMKVDRFSVFGIGPALLKLGTWRGTEFVISAIPFGAYVLIRGMEPQDEADPSPDDPASFREKPLYQRAAVIVGGPVANYLTAIGLFFVLFMTFGHEGAPRALAIDAFEDGSAAHAAGLQVGDEIVRVGETRIDPALLANDLRAASEPYRGRAMPVEVLRDGALVAAEVDVPEKGYALGITPRVVAPLQGVSSAEAAQLAFAQPFAITAHHLNALYELVTFQQQGTISGPVEIVNQIAKAAERGVPDFLKLTAVISTLLGMFNLLPLPALDGGRLCFLGFEALARRPANPRVEEMIHGYGMLALLTLLVWATVGDFRRLL